MKRKRANEEDDNIALLPHQKRGRPLPLGENLDHNVQLNLKRVQDGGGVVTARIAIAAARGIIMSCDRLKLVEFGGYVNLNRHWAYSLLTRMNFVKRKVTTAKSKYSVAEFQCLKFLQNVVTTVEMEEIPPELILNWDQTGIKIVPSSTWTMDQARRHRWSQ